VVISYVHVDHLNAPTKVSRTTDNKLRWRWDHDPFGIVIPSQNPQSLGSFVYNLRYPGQAYDSETGLSYNYFRDYDPQTGRYVESDPLGLVLGVASSAVVPGNLRAVVPRLPLAMRADPRMNPPYAYVDGSPVKYTDPTGQCPWCFVGVGALVGAGANVVGSLISGNPVTVAGVLGGAAAGAAAVAMAGEVVAGAVVGGTVRAIGALIGDAGISAGMDAIDAAQATSPGENKPAAATSQSCP
jgi:RHS repeat-associated protein